MRDLFCILKETLEKGKDAVLVSIVESSGSVPRGGGAMMLVSDEGRIAGTTGGGIGEFKAEQAAKEALRLRRSRLENYRLYHADDNDIDSICGGAQEAYFRFIDAADKKVIALCKELDRMYEKGEQCWLIEELSEGDEGEFCLFSSKNGLMYAKGQQDMSRGTAPAEKPDVFSEILNLLAAAPKVIETAGRRFYTARLVSAGRVFIFGGGHVSQQLVPTLTRCDFRCTVLEDRPEFCDPALFEGVVSTLKVDMDDLAPVAEELTSDDFVCIMTRGHRNDYEVVYQMLKSKACYIGVIGSRSKVAALKEHLLADGFTANDLERLTMPIGIEICSETPAEIAVSIAAQLIMVRAIKTGSRKVKHLADAGNR